jgi:DHA3 family macrolide efflux protein-like MFS transporter
MEMPMRKSNQWKRDTALFLTSQTISLFGSSLVQYAIMWYITLNTQSGIMMTIFIICGFLPTFFLSPFAGVWADRYHRKMLIAVSDSVIALTTLLLAIAFMAGYKEIWLLFAASSIRALGAGVQTPAVGAFLPQFVPSDKLTQVNATYTSIQSVVTLVSPMVSGALLTMASIESIFFIDVATAAAAVAILLFLLRVPAHAKASAKQTSGYFADMREGYRYIKQHGYVKTFLAFSACFMFFAAPVAFLTPLQVARSFGPEVWRLTVIEVAFSLGMVVGGAVMAYWGGFRNRVYTMILANAILGWMTFALGLIPVFWIYSAVMTLIGVTMPMFNTPSTVLLQEKVGENYLGRVFGVFSMISSSVMPLGMLVFGPIADVIAIEWLLIGTGLLLFFLSLLMLGNRTFVEAGRPATADSGA